MATQKTAFRVEIFHQTEGLIGVFPFATLPEARQLFEHLLEQSPPLVYRIQLRDAKEDLLASWPELNQYADRTGSSG